MRLTRRCGHRKNDRSSRFVKVQDVIRLVRLNTSEPVVGVDDSRVITNGCLRRLLAGHFYLNRPVQLLVLKKLCECGWAERVSKRKIKLFFKKHH